MASNRLQDHGRKLIGAVSGATRKSQVELADLAVKINRGGYLTDAERVERLHGRIENQINQFIEDVKEAYDIK